MQTAYVNKRKRLIPENWNEVKANTKLLIWTVGLFFKELTQQEILNLFSAKVFKIGKVKLSRIEKVFKKYPDNSQADKLAETLYRASESVKFVTENQLEITENLFPKLFKFRRLYGTECILSDSEIWEFALCENDFFQFAKTQEPEHLDNLISKIYRPRKLFSKQKQSFNENSAKRRVKRISKLPVAVKWIIFRWFAYQRELIIKAHPHTFKKSDSSGSGGNWADTIIAMSVVGDEEKTAQTKLSVILRRIDNENKAVEEQNSKNQSL